MLLSKPDNETFHDTLGPLDKEVNEPICEGYKAAVKDVFLLRSLAIILLTLTGHKVRLIVEETVEKVGYGDITSKSTYVMRVVFYCYIYNFAILLLMNNANLSS